MFLSTVKSKGNFYIYLCSYNKKKDCTRLSVTVHGFGRREIAISNMYRWRNNFKEFPVKLIMLGCKRSDLDDWIRTLETGITKTGKKFKAIV